MASSKEHEFTYQVGGSLPPNSSSYVTRQADIIYYKALKAGSYSFVLNSRQSGKSSLRAKVMHQLQVEGTACAVVDITSIVSYQITPDEWYFGISQRLIKSFGIKIDILEWWDKNKRFSPVQKFSEFIDEIILKTLTGNIVIFIDEIDNTLKLKFKDDFFLLVRSFFDKRADNIEYQRLTFSLIGVATPFDLIENRVRTPFNIGKEIDLYGFSIDEMKPLAIGLSKKFTNHSQITRAIHDWTGGQPLLTQKLCKLVLALPNIPEGSEYLIVESIVRENIINNWESQDNPQHLKTIKERVILASTKTQKVNNNAIPMLEMYKKILLDGEIDNDGSVESIELKLSGLVIQYKGKLKSYNLIYRAIFNLEWVDHEIDNIRPHAESIKRWLKSEKDHSFLLRGNELKKAQNWATKHRASKLDYQFFSDSQKWEQERIQRQLTTALLVFIPIAAVIGGVLWNSFSRCPDGEIRAGSKNECTPISIRERISSGEKTHFPATPNSNRALGISHFKSGAYEEAKAYFARANNDDPNDPEVEIYFNNTIARLSDNPYRLVAVVPTDNDLKPIGKEILRGIADAQAGFHESNSSSRKLEILILNDSNDPIIAKVIANWISEQVDIIGVIGHTTSDVTKEVLPIYQENGVPLISPTSTSTRLFGETFFRTTPSDADLGRTLANYVTEKLDIKKILIAYDHGSIYSESFRDAFLKGYSDEYREDISIDLSLPSFSADNIVRKVKESESESVLLIPSGLDQTNSAAITLIRNLTDSQNTKNPILILGGDSLYRNKTLQEVYNNVLLEDKETIQGLILAVPWYPRTLYPYANKANEKWQGQISWRTATSYDAAQALIATFHNDVSRDNVLRKLKLTNLPASQTSGQPLSFTSSGDRLGKPTLVQVKYNEGQFSFVPLRQYRNN